MVMFEKANPRTLFSGDFEATPSLLYQESEDRFWKFLILLDVLSLQNCMIDSRSGLVYKPVQNAWLNAS